MKACAFLKVSHHEVIEHVMKNVVIAASETLETEDSHTELTVEDAKQQIERAWSGRKGAAQIATDGYLTFPRLGVNHCVDNARMMILMTRLPVLLP